MIRVYAIIGGRPQMGQTTFAAELAFECVKRGASACILTPQCHMEAVGFDCFGIQGLAPVGEGLKRDPAALAADLAQLEDYDYFFLDLPLASLDLAIAAGLSGADIVVPVSIDQGGLGDASTVFKALAHHPPPQPVQLVLSQVRNLAAATDTAEKLLASVEQRLKLTACLAGALPWDSDLAALADPAVLPSMALPNGALSRSIPKLADRILGKGVDGGTAPVALVFWEQFQTLLQQLQPMGTEIAAAPIELSNPVTAPQAPAEAESLTPPPPKAAATAQTQPEGFPPPPELSAVLGRIAASLEQLTAEVQRLRIAMAEQFGVSDEAAGENQNGLPSEPVRLDFEAFRQSRDKARGEG